MRPDELVVQYMKRINELLAKLDDLKSLPEDEERASVDGYYLGILTVIESLYGGNSPPCRPRLSGSVMCVKK